MRPSLSGLGTDMLGVLESLCKLGRWLVSSAWMRASMVEEKLAF